jgi:hypothetical protein
MDKTERSTQRYSEPFFRTAAIVNALASPFFSFSLEPAHLPASHARDMSQLAYLGQSVLPELFCNSSCLFAYRQTEVKRQATSEKN